MTAGERNAGCLKALKDYRRTVQAKRKRQERYKEKKSKS